MGSSSPGCGKQRVLSPHQLPHLHSDVAELVTQQATEAHEGRGIAHDLLRLWHHLVPVGRRPRGLITPGAYRGDAAERRGPPHATRGTRGPEITGQAQQQLPKAHSLSLGVSGISGCPKVARGTNRWQRRNLRGQAGSGDSGPSEESGFLGLWPETNFNYSFLPWV